MQSNRIRQTQTGQEQGNKSANKFPDPELYRCLGEERLVTVPPVLGFGARGSRAYGVPPNTPLTYQTKLISINGREN